MPAAREHRPGLLIVSAGYDAHRDDPLANCELDDDAYGDMSATVSQYPYTIGQLGVEACLAASQGKKLPANVKAPVQVVTKDNVAKATQNFPKPVESYNDPFASLIGG